MDHLNLYCGQLITSLCWRGGHLQTLFASTHHFLPPVAAIATMLHRQQVHSRAGGVTHNPQPCAALPSTHRHVNMHRSVSTAALNANERLQSGLSSSAQLQQASPLTAVEAYQQGTLAFGFSAGGLLFPVSADRLNRCHNVCCGGVVQAYVSKQAQLLHDSIHQQIGGCSVTHSWLCVYELHQTASSMTSFAFSSRGCINAGICLQTQSAVNMHILVLQQ